MGKISEIKDRLSLEAWLEARPEVTRQHDGVAIAHRAAMRVLPAYLMWIARRPLEDGLTALPILRASMLSSIAAELQSSEIDEAIAAYNATASSTATLAASATFSTKTADSAFAAEVATAAAMATSDTALAAATAADFVSSRANWSEIRADAESIAAFRSRPLGPLWPDPIADPFASDWDKALQFWQTDDTDWSFWITWATAIRNGTPQNLQMLTEIATQEDDFWQGTDPEINARIAAMVEKYQNADEDIALRPEQALSRITVAVRLQLETLKAFLDQQIQFLHGQNDFTTAEGEKIQARLTLLLSIRATVERMQAACEDEANPANALVVVEQSLPDVVKDADDLAEQEEEPVISETIVTMSATIKHMTDNGTPGNIATGIAAFDLMSRTLRGWFKRDKEKSN